MLNEIGAMAAALGYSLEDCGNYCRNVRRLARLVLQKAALHEFAGLRSGGAR